MPAFPDLTELLSTHNLSLVGLDIKAREHGPQLTLQEVSAFFASRRIIATVAEGATYGSASAFTANFVLTPSNEKAMQSSEQGAESSQYVGVASHDGEIVNGQEMGEFLLGIAYALNTVIIVDGTVRFEPGVPQPEFLDHPVDIELSEQLAVINGELPLSALPALLLTTGSGKYGLKDGKQLVLPDNSVNGFALGASSFLGQLPNVMFSRLGDARMVQLQMTPQSQFDLTIMCAPNFSAVSSYPQRSRAETVSSLLMQGSFWNYTDELPDRSSKDPKKPSDTAVPLQSFEVFDQLANAAPHLVRLPPEQLFTRVAELLGFSMAIRSAVAAFNTHPPHHNSTELAGIPLTSVEAVRTNWMQRFLTALAMNRTLESLNAKRGRWFTRWLSTVPGTVCIAVVCTLVALFTLAVLVVPGVSDALEVRTASMYRAIAVCVISAGTAALNWMAASRLKLVRGLLHQAHHDGVLEKRL